MFGKRTQARLKIGEILRGTKTNFRVVGCLLFREWDRKDKTHYYWEEWELLGLENYDSWVEYDQYSHAVSLYEPIRFTTAIDPSTMQQGQQFALTSDDGKQYQVTVTEVGAGEIVKIKGKNTYQVFEGESMSYATLQLQEDGKQHTRRVTVEKYNNREYDAYIKKPLSAKRQKELFGRTITPTTWPLIIAVLLVLLGIIVHGILQKPPDQQQGAQQGGGGVPRSIYGGGGGGLGK